jgi:hypothetical protein
MDNLREKIDSSRNIKENSLNAYLISIKKLNEFITKKEFKNLDFLKDEKKVLEKLKELKLTTQKNYLSAIIVSLSAYGDKYEDDLKTYRKRLEQLNEVYNSEIKKNEKTETQEKNWVSMKDLKKVMNSYKLDLKERGAFSKDELTRRELDIMQRWVVANLYLNDENPPIRLDYGNMRIISENDFDKLKDDELDKNFLVVKNRTNKYFHFGDYKTEKTYSKKEIKVGKKLNSVLNIWLKHNKKGGLLYDTKGDPMSSNTLGKYIKKVFEKTGKQVSINLIRHIFISEKFPPQKEDEKEEVASKMLHSVKIQKAYSKK